MDLQLLVSCLVLLAVAAGAVGSVSWMAVSLRRARRTGAATEQRLQRLERQVAELAGRFGAAAGGSEGAALGGRPLTAAGDAPPAAPAHPSPPVVPAAAPAAPGETAPPAQPAGPAAGRPSPPPSTPWWSGLEERLGAHLPVWLGAIALALAGAFLVKYSVDQGWIGPTVRVGLAAAFGAGMLLAARLLRRPAERIAAALAAAGVAVLYAAVLAAVHLYGLLPAAAGFALMVLVTAAAVALAIVHGPIVAVVGLVGGFLTPYWIRLGDPDPKRLFAYLLLLHVAVVAVSRRRAWPGLSAASLAAGLLWVVAFLVSGFERGDGPWLQLFVLVSVAAWAVARRAGHEAETRASWEIGSYRVAMVTGACAALVYFAAIVGVEGFGPVEWGMLALLVAALLVLDRFVDGFGDLSWVAAAMVAALLLGWTSVLHLHSEELPRFLFTAAGMTAILTLGAWAALWQAGGRSPRWAVLSAASGTALPGIAWLGWYFTWLDVPGPRPGPEVPWPAVALVLAVLFVALSLPVARHRSAGGAGDAMEAALTALVVAATVHVTWAAVLRFDGAAQYVALALEVPVLVGLAGRFRVPVLETLGVVLAASVTFLLVAGLFGFDSRLALEPVPLRWAFAGTLTAFAVAAVVLLAGPGRRLDSGQRTDQGMVAMMLVLLVAWSHEEAYRALEPAGFAWTGAGIAWLALGVAALVAARRWPVVFTVAGHEAAPLPVLGGLALAAYGLVVHSPLWTGAPVGGTPVVNHLLWLHGVPLLLLALAARLLSGSEAGEVRITPHPRILAAACSVGALVCLFVLISLEVLQAFRGPVLTAASPRPYAEGWALSIAWLLLGTALLVAGIAGASRLLRGAALAVTGLAVVKVFLFDVARLGDLYRVLSFLGLGLSLLLLAWLYQRFVFRPAAADRA